MPRWDSAARERQRQLIKIQHPWCHSTGPTSDYGRLVSSQNSQKHRRKNHHSVSSVSPSQKGDIDIDRPMEVGDFVKYIGDFAPTLQQCRGQPMMVLGFSSGAVACHLKGSGGDKRPRMLPV